MADTNPRRKDAVADLFSAYLEQGGRGVQPRRPDTCRAAASGE